MLRSMQGRQRAARCSLIVVAVVIATAGQAWAGPPVFSTLAILNTQAPGKTGVGWSVQVTSVSPGKWVAVWHSTNSLGDKIGRDWDILVSRSADGGVTWTPPQPLNTNAAADRGNDRSPVVASDGAGYLLAVWTSADPLGGKIGLDWDLLAARSLDGGRTWTDPVPLNNNAAFDWGDDEDVRVRSDRKGGWLAVWHSTDSLGNTIGGDRDILLARSRDGGKSWTPPVALNTNAAVDSGFDISPRVATDTAGNWVAVWSSGDSLAGSIGLDRDVLTARSADGGASWSRPMPLNTNAAVDTRADGAPSVDSDAKGIWLAVWSSADTLADTLGMDRDILVARSTDQGASWTVPAALNRSAGLDSREDSSPTIVCDRNGNWLTVWHSWDSFGEHLDVDADIFLSYSSDGGLGWSEPSTVNPGASEDDGDDVLPHVATDGLGRWVAAWQAFELAGGKIGGFNTEWDILTSSGSVAPGR